MPLVLAFLSTREAHARTQLDGTAFQNFMKLQKMEILSQESTDLGVSGGHEQFRALQLHAGVLQLAECCKLQLKINILVCCNSPSAVKFNRKPIFWCAATRRVL